MRALAEGTTRTTGYWASGALAILAALSGYAVARTQSASQS